MENTIWAYLIPGIPSALAGVAAVITAVSNKKNDIKEMKQDVKSIKADIQNCRTDISVTKEASFYALQAHVENGVNGDVKKAHARLKANVFDNGK